MAAMTQQSREMSSKDNGFSPFSLVTVPDTQHHGLGDLTFSQTETSLNRLGTRGGDYLKVNKKSSILHLMLNSGITLRAQIWIVKSRLEVCLLGLPLTGYPPSFHPLGSPALQSRRLVIRAEAITAVISDFLAF
ncbi:hypothetical protein RRG08_041991 [Elysia crispata]|uniref:Uncharacterized protein n=1 Tax=Elysia crispata TaxID=231223 RepID=A0AAE0Z063_9GAST|nr:hypothetical protein RRG08_041991 [Elysia crispata]